MQIHIQRGSEAFGPYSLEEVKRYLDSGQLVPSDLAWPEGAAEWVPLASLSCLTSVPAMARPRPSRIPSIAWVSLVAGLAAGVAIWLTVSVKSKSSGAPPSPASSRPSQEFTSDAAQSSLVSEAHPDLGSISAALPRAVGKGEVIPAALPTDIPASLLGKEAPAGSVWLAALDHQPSRSGNGQIRGPGPRDPWGNPQAADRADLNTPIHLGGKTYRHGLWSHDRDSLYEVEVHGKATRLSMMVGLVDENGKQGRLRFVVLADGRTVADSGFMRGGDNPKLLTADIRGAQRVAVLVDTGGDGNWANAGVGGALVEVAPDERLHAAAFSGRLEELKSQVASHAEGMATTDGLFGVTPFGAACLGGQAEAARFLCQRGADANATDQQQNTILHLAAARGNPDAVLAAVRAGTDTRLRNAAGQTAHDLATSREDARSIALLAEAELWDVPRESPPPAAGFEVTDLDGRRVASSDFKGRTVVLFFYCEMPWNKGFHYGWLDYAEALQQSAEARRGELVICVATPDKEPSVKAFMTEHGYTFRVLLDAQDTIRRQLHLYGLPAVVLDKAGRIAWQRRLWQRSQIEEGGLFLAVDRVLAGSVKYLPQPSAARTSPGHESVLFDFESGFGSWKTSGDCWGAAPACDALYPGLVKGYIGRGFLSSFTQAGGRATGLASSPEFEITQPYLHLLLGGGDLPDHCAVSLVVNGCTVRRSTGVNSAELRPVWWNVRELIGQRARIEVYDAGTKEARDFILLDQVVASDSPATPASYAKRFDPDDPLCRAEVAAATPPSYQALQRGEFHIEAKPGRTYRLEQTHPVRWPGEAVDWLQLVVPCPPTHLAHTVHSISGNLQIGGARYSGREIATKRPMMSRALLFDIPARQTAERAGSVTVACELTVNTLKLCSGPPAQDPGDLPRSLRSGYTTAFRGYPFDNPWMKQYMTQHRLWRLPQETDAAYLLRAYRFFQRSFTYMNVPWGGWSSSQPWALEAFERQGADCGLAILMAMLLRANDIPALVGQGCWLGDNGAPVGAHVRTLVFLRKVGWMWLDVGPEVQGVSEPITIGAEWGDNFMSDGLDDIAQESIIPRPLGAKTVLRGWYDGGDWWRSWVVNRSNGGARTAETLAPGGLGK